MSLPNGETREAALFRWANGNAEAAALLSLLADLVRAADDFVDDEKGRQSRMAQVLHSCLVLLPQNAFYREHAQRFAGVFLDALLSWEVSDEWRTSGDRKRETFGYVYREAVDRIPVMVAYLTGGLDHARAVMRDVFEVCHTGSDETVEQWVSEG